MGKFDSKAFKAWAREKGLYKTRGQEEYSICFTQKKCHDVHLSLKIKWSEVDKAYHTTFLVFGFGFAKGIFYDYKEYYQHEWEISLASESDTNCNRAWESMLAMAEQNIRKMLGLDENDYCSLLDPIKHFRGMSSENEY